MKGHMNEWRRGGLLMVILIDNLSSRGLTIPPRAEYAFGNGKAINK
jgi:hypothetical protein